MANKKVSQLTSKPSVLVTDLFPIADPSTGQLYKTTISDLGTAIGSGVSSVNTLVGAVVLDTDDIQELVSPTNKWFTDTRARAALSASSPLTYNSGTGAFGIQVANGSQNGYLSSTDWTTFNAKQAALSGTGFVKISGTTISYDNSTYLTTSSAASTYLALAGGTMTGNLLLPANNTVGGTNYYIGQVMATSDNWKIYGNSTEGDKGELVFDLGDNGSPFDSGGQRFRFFYSAGADGTAKSVLYIDYNTTTFATSLVGTSATFSSSLSGTTATFSGDITIGTIGNSSSAYHRGSFNGTNTSANLSSVYFSGGDGSQNRAGLKVYQTWGGTYTDTCVDLFVTKGGVGGTTALSINGSGAASFSSSISLNGSISNSADSSLLTIKQTSQTANNGIYIERSGERNGYFMYVGGSVDSLIFRRNYFGTQGDVMSLTRDGKVGINTTIPAKTLTVVDTAEQLRLSYDGGSVYTDFKNDSAGGLLINTTGGYIINYIAGSAKTRINSNGDFIVYNLGTGLVYSNAGALTSTNPSDSRLKTDIKSIEYGLSDILKLRPVSYNWKDDKVNQGIQFGFIAQEVQEIMPDAIKEFGDKTKFLGLEKDAIYATLINAIKELNNKIETLENK